METKIKNETMEDKFIKIHSYNGEVHIVNITSIAHIEFPDDKAVVTLKTVDENKVNTKIEDAIRGRSYYQDLLTP
jgi:hypothetical protein